MEQRIIYTTDKGSTLDISITPTKESTFNNIQMKVNSCNTLVDAMRFQAANNKEVCDEMVAKAKNFETSVKLEDPKEAWNWKK